MLQRGSLSLFLVAVMACDNEVIVEGGGGSGGESPGGGNTGAGNTGGSDGGCAAFADEPVGETLSIVIRNDSPLDVYLPAECGALGFSIVSEDDPEGFYGNTGGFCLQTCEELQTDSQILCEACAPEAILLPAFSTYSVGWTTNGLVTAEMPSECWFDAFQGTQTCRQRVLAVAGSYSIEALTAYAGCDGCECDPNSGVCSGYPSGNQAFTEPLDFTLPDDDGVLTYVIDTCAFGCP
ncbi:MAG: hypothetical protein IPG04_32070 [Polyangiaceae bacterium]|nr:hypothetical protein [Polyangiaceae bacterium]